MTTAPLYRETSAPVAVSHPTTRVKLRSRYSSQPQKPSSVRTAYRLTAGANSKVNVLGARPFSLTTPGNGLLCMPYHAVGFSPSRWQAQSLPPPPPFFSASLVGAILHLRCVRPRVLSTMSCRWGDHDLPGRLLRIVFLGNNHNALTTGVMSTTYFPWGGARAHHASLA